MSPRTGSRTAIICAMVSAAAMIAHHVGSKAVRDALFLSSFPITALPTMVMAAAGFSVLAVFAASRAMTRFTPARLVPAAFAVSSALFLVVWLLHDRAPKPAAIAIYLQIMGLGSLLTSGFWSMVSERFDPRSAKRQFGRIAGAGTLGGMLGGVLAERIAAWTSATMVLPVLAAEHLVCAVVLTGLKPLGNPADDRHAADRAADGESGSIFRILKDASYLRTLALLVLLGTISAAMIDFVFKAQAVAAYGRGEPLLRFFAVFYSATAVLTFLVQTAFSGLSLARLGLAKTVGSLPFTVSLGAAGAIAMPGLISATIARGVEAVFRGSLFRGGYELFYTPIPAREKRAAKSIVDVGFDRLGDALGNGVVNALLRLAPVAATQWILGAAILVAAAGLAVASRLHKAYIGALEKGLLDRAAEVEKPELNVNDTMMLSGIMHTMTIMNPGAGRPGGSVLDSSTRTPTMPYRPASIPPPAPVASTASTQTPAPPWSPTTTAIFKPPSAAPASSPPSSSSGTPALNDPLVQQILDLRSGDLRRVKKLLDSPEPPNAALVPHIVNLLAWDQIYGDAIRSLRRVADTHVGQLVDVLLDPKTDFAMRRRLPRVLVSSTSQRAADGLMAALRDRRFEVRFQCGRALSMLVQRNPKIRIGPEAVYDIVLQEVAVGKPVWESHRLLDKAEERESSPFVDEFLRDRTNRSLEHVFTLLSLTLPTDALQIAFRGLHTDDQHLRGTALEYLESTLPPAIRDRLWPFLEDSRAPRPAKPAATDAKPKEAVLEELLHSNQSIMLNLAELRKKMEPGGKPK
jgi:AAA family ATP:ADP antiporter